MDDIVGNCGSTPFDDTKTETVCAHSNRTKLQETSTWSNDVEEGDLLEPTCVQEVSAGHAVSGQEDNGYLWTNNSHVPSNSPRQPNKNVQTSPERNVPDAFGASEMEGLSAKWMLADIFMAYFFIGPLVVTYWFSTWSLLDYYLFPDDLTLSAWVSFISGYGVFTVASVLQNTLLNFSSKRKRLKFVMSRVYTYVMALLSVNQWRACWLLLDIYTGVGWKNALVCCTLAFLVMMALRCCKQVPAPPAVIGYDIPHRHYYTMTTFFQLKPGSFRFVLDSVVTVFIIASLGISVWRGVWGLADAWITPEDITMSAIWSLVISYSLAFVLLTSRPYCQKLSSHLVKRHWLLQLIFEDLVTLMHAMCSINHWRGYWILFYMHLPGPPIVLYWVCHTLGYSVLTVAMASNSIPVRGCAHDSESSGGQGVLNDIYYVRTMILAYRRTRKMKRHNISRRTPTSEEPAHEISLRNPIT